MKKIIIIFYFLLSVINSYSQQWGQLGNTINGNVNLGALGTSVATNDEGNIIAVGIPSRDDWGYFGTSSEKGMVQVYIRDSVTLDWVQLGGNLIGEENGERFGAAIDLNHDGTVLAVGAPLSGSCGSNSSWDDCGYIKIYKWIDSTSTWIMAQKICGEGGWQGQGGSSVALDYDGNTVVFGMPLQYGTSSSNRGEVEVYREDNNGNWNQIGEFDPVWTYDKGFGAAVDISNSGDIVVVGAPGTRWWKCIFIH